MTELSARPIDTTDRLQITVSDAYHGTVDQATIDQWELRQARLALSVLKEGLRGEAMIRLLAPYIEAADQQGREVAAASNGEWGPPVESTFEVKGLGMEEFFAWFQDHLSDELAMLAGNPDHYEIRMPEGIITETIGGIPTRFMFHFDPVDPPASFRLDPEFPVRPMGGGGAALATLLDGVTPQALPRAVPDRRGCARLLRGSRPRSGRRGPGGPGLGSVVLPADPNGKAVSGGRRSSPAKRPRRRPGLGRSVLPGPSVAI
jgi:hypothetical protein